MKRIACLAGLLFGCAPVAWGDTIVNPGFETGDFTGWQHTGSAAILAEHDGVHPSEGSYMLVMDGVGEVWQDFWIEEPEYLQIDKRPLSGEAPGGVYKAAHFIYRIEDDGSLDFWSAGQGWSRNNHRWGTGQTYLPAGHWRLSFRVLDGDYTLYADNVRFYEPKPVPTPSAYAGGLLLLGLCGAGMYWQRKRQPA